MSGRAFSALALIGNRPRLLADQACLAQTIDKSLRVGWVLERQATDMILRQVVRIDLHEFVPNPSGLVQLIQMT